MIKSRIATAAALMVVAGAASAAGASVTATWVSDYDWRGVTQNDESGAFQLGGTYTAESGVYASLWGSTLASGSDVTEIDEIVGYAFGDSAKAVGVDLGINYYSYTNFKDANYGELYAGISHGWFGAKLWWSPDFGGKTNSGSQSEFYLEGNVTAPISDALSFTAHFGYSDGDGIAAVYGGSKHYTDWSAGFAYNIGNFSTFLKYVDGSDNKAFYYPNNSVGSRFVFGVSTTLPWAK